MTAGIFTVPVITGWRICKDPEERKVKVMNRRFRKMLLIAVSLLIWRTGSPVPAGGEWLPVSGEDSIPEKGFLVQEYTGTVRITFLGDCTLGSEEKTRTAFRGFPRTIEKNGTDWPFRNLRILTAEDDLTVANLEGVLSDRELQKVEKDFNFIGSADYTEILKAGSVECVTLANNHSHDYGTAGYHDTKAALEAAGIAYFGTDCSVIWQNEEGLMIGFLGAAGSLSGSRAKEYEKKADLLRSIGCSAVITVMHAGTEYESAPDSRQKQIADCAARCGSDLVIGHHPHVVQGFEIRDSVPVVYSLGNCVFGGNINPKDYDALAVRAELSFLEGELTGISLRFFPLSVSGESRYNDYSPVLLEGADAERVLKKMEESTGISVGSSDSAGDAGVSIPVK